MEHRSFDILTSGPQLVGIYNCRDRNHFQFFFLNFKFVTNMYILYFISIITKILIQISKMHFTMA